MNKSIRLITLLLCLISVVFFTSCKTMKNVKDITKHANEILEEIADLSRTVNVMVESGELEEGVGRMIDQRINHAGQNFEDILNEGSGSVFVEADGTIENTFEQMDQLIAEIKIELMGGKDASQLILMLSEQLEEHSLRLNANAEDLIHLTFGNTAIVIAQATDAAFTLAAWIILGVGLVLIIFTLIIWGRKMGRGLKTFVFSLIGLFMGLFLSVLFIPSVKGYVLYSLNIGEKLVEKAHQPRILYASPDTFQLGSTPSIFLHGVHLDQLDFDSLEVGLYQSNEKVYGIPQFSIKTISATQIVLSDFKKWENVEYKELKRTYQKRVGKPLSINDYKPFSFKFRPKKKSQPSTSVPLHTFNIKPIQVPLWKDLSAIYKEKFGLEEGHYEIRVQDKRKKVQDYTTSAQPIVFRYPVPPPPVPDLAVISVNWENGTPIKGDRAKLKVVLEVREGHRIKSDVIVGLSSNPSLTGPRQIRVSRETLNRTKNGRITLVTSTTYRLDKSGNHKFNIRVDQTNRVAESNESNNKLSRKLMVNGYDYTVKVKFQNFLSRKDVDRKTDKYRIKLQAYVTGKPRWDIDFKQNGNPGKFYPINQSKTFSGVKEGDRIRLYTTGKEVDGRNKYLGEFSFTSDPITLDFMGNSSRKVESIVLKTSHYDVYGEYEILKRVK